MFPGTEFLILYNLRIAETSSELNVGFTIRVSQFVVRFILTLHISNEVSFSLYFYLYYFVVYHETI